MSKLLCLSLLLACLCHALPLVGLKKVSETPSKPSQDIRLRVISNGEISYSGTNRLVIKALQADDVIVAEADYQYVWLSMSWCQGDYLLFLPHGLFEFVVPDLAVAYPAHAFEQEFTVQARVATPQELQTRRNLACNPFDFRYRNECGPANDRLADDSPAVSNGECRAFPHAYANRVTRNEHIFHPRNAIDGSVTAGRGHSAFPYQSWGYGQHNDSEFVLYFGRPVTIDTINLVLRADYSGKQKEHDTWWQSATIVFSDGMEEIIHPQRGGDLQSFPVKPRRTDSIRLKNLIRAMRNTSENWAALVEIQAWGQDVNLTQNPVAVKNGFKIDTMNSTDLVTTDAVKAADVAAVMRNVLDYAKQNARADGNTWEDGVFHIGNMDAFLTTGDWNHYLYSRHVAECHRYQVNHGQVTSNGDNYCLGQSYITLAQLAPRDNKLANIIACTDFNLQKNAVDYHWVDAIFMSAQVYTQLARLIGKPAYINCEFNSYRSWRQKLFNESDGLWYRDLRFVNKRTLNNRPVYWSRGNAWAFAALARQLVFLPDKQSPAYQLYLADFRTMAKSLKHCQRADGTWNASLADPLHYGGMETTGTAGFLYGFAIGVQYGLLNKTDYLPVVLQAYKALTTSCQIAPGHIGYMQHASDSPNNYRSETVSRKLSNRFGIGLFLMGASAVMRMCEDYQPSLLTIPLDFQSQEPAFLKPAAGFYRGKMTVSTTHAFQAVNSPSKLCDGKWSDNDGERWSTNTWPASVIFDFQKQLTFSKIALMPYRYRNYAFTLEFSTNGNDWTTALDIIHPKRNGIIQYYDLPPHPTRYARLTIKKARGCYSGPWVSIKEVCFYP